MNEEMKIVLNDLKKYAIEGGEHTLMEYEIKHILAYINNLQNRIDKALNFIDCHFKEMAADEEAQELKNILRGDDEN